MPSDLYRVFMVKMFKTLLTLLDVRIVLSCHVSSNPLGPFTPCNSNLVPINQAFPPSPPSCSHFLIIIICSQLPLFFFFKWCVCTRARLNPMELTWRRIQFPWYSRGGQRTTCESSLLPPCGDWTRVIKFGNKHVYPLIHLNTYIDHVLSGHT